MIFILAWLINPPNHWRQSARYYNKWGWDNKLVQLVKSVHMLAWNNLKQKFCCSFFYSLHPLYPGWRIPNYWYNDSKWQAKFSPEWYVQVCHQMVNNGATKPSESFVKSQTTCSFIIIDDYWLELWLQHNDYKFVCGKLQSTDSQHQRPP